MKQYDIVLVESDDKVLRKALNMSYNQLHDILLNNEKLFKVGRVSPDEDNFEFTVLGISYADYKDWIQHLDDPNYNFIRLTEQEVEDLFKIVSKIINNKAFL